MARLVGGRAQGNQGNSRRDSRREAQPADRPSAKARTRPSAPWQRRAGAIEHALAKLVGLGSDFPFDGEERADGGPPIKRGAAHASPVW